MGCGDSKVQDEGGAGASEKSSDVSSDYKKKKYANEVVKRTYHVPLFGCAGAGKSTIFKAVRIAKLDGFDDEECKEYAKKMQMEL